MIAEFGLSDRQAEAILNMRLRSLRKLEEMEIAKERAKLAKEREELAKLVESPARQRTRLKKDLAEVKDKYGDARRTRIEEVAATREIDWSAMIEKEPITVILSQRGWIRAMKGHVAPEEVEAIKYREGDGPAYLVRASTTDRLVLIARQRPGLHAERRQIARRARVRRAGAAADRPRWRGRDRGADGGAGRRANIWSPHPTGAGS